jgi:hypothetical protein
MTHDEQHKMIVALRDVERKMSRSEEEEFSMYVKRDKDDEDLDVLSQKKLQLMYDRLIVARGKHA